MSFTDGKPRIATEKDCATRWAGDLPGKRFRCGLCGYRFRVGDYWRFLYTNGLESINGVAIYAGNPLVCKKCDTDDVIQQWKRHCECAYETYWFFM